MSEWQPISTAPRDTDLLVGKWVNDEWRVCQSAHCYDSGSYVNNEEPYWFWTSDWDATGITEGEGPSHWMLIPAPPTPSAADKQ